MRLRPPTSLRCAACLAVLCMVAGCVATPQPAPALPQTPAAFAQTDPRTAAADAAAPQAEGAWWKVFADPLLDQLVNTALRGNTNIQLAAARLAKSRALLHGAEANRWPQAAITTGVNRQGGPLINAAGGSGTLWTLAGGISYEADVFGRMAHEIDAAMLDAQSRAALLQSAHLMVQADVAQAYFGIRLLDAERAAMLDTADALTQTLGVTERRFTLGSVAELDVARIRVEAAAAHAELYALDRRRAELQHALAVLVGEVASAFHVAPDVHGWHAPLPVIPAGIPSAVLARRPDVAAAQRTLQASQTRLGIAKTAWFPGIALTASQGFASPNLRDLIAVASRAYGLGALLSLPLFDGGRREAAVQGAGAEMDSALASYREQILVAFREVEDQLSALRLLADQAQAQAQAQTAADRATALAYSRYHSGFASQLEVLDMQRSALRNRRQALQVRLAQYQSTVGLIRALGGGWDTAEVARVSHHEFLER
jgi:outer membrane protein, multidrug efflux system